MRRKEVLYAVVGGVVGAVLALAAGSVLPLGAQNEVRDAEFEVITCKQIRVIDSAGNTGVFLYGTDIGGYVGVYGKDKGGRGSVWISFSEHGGYVGVSDEVGSGKDSFRTVVGMGIGDRGEGHVGVYDRDGLRKSVQMTTDENGGRVSVWGNGGKEERAVMGVDVGGGGRVGLYVKDGTPRVGIGSNDYGGQVSLHDKDGDRATTMGIDEYGGNVSVYGRGNDYSRVRIGVNEYGNGAVSTWDKNRYRLATLGE